MVAWLLAQQSGGGGLLSLLLPFLVLIAVFYFFIILPQNRERKKKEKMLASLRKGDKVATAGGLIGVIQSVDDDTVTLQLGKGVTVKLEKWAVSKVLSKAEE